VSIFKRRPRRLPRQLALGQLEDAMGRVQENRSEAEEPPPARRERVRTPWGRKAHLRDDSGHGVLCGWPAQQWEEAPAGMEDCRPCGLAAEVVPERRPA
jgi:hypothetical protein